VEQGVDVFDAFNRMGYTRSIISPENIEQLIADLKREIFQPIRVVPEESRFLYEGGVMTLNMALENPNCEEVRASRIEIKPVTDAEDNTVNLALPAPDSARSHAFAPSARDIIEIPLDGVPDFKTLVENNRIGKTYAVTASVDTEWGTEDISFELPLKGDDFVETFDVTVEDFVFVDHPFKKYDKLFLRLKFDGELFDTARFTVLPELENCTFVPLEPADPVRFFPEDTLADAGPVYVFQTLQDGDTTLKSIKNPGENLSLNWEFVHDEGTVPVRFRPPAETSGTLQKRVESSNFRSYLLPEIALFFVLLLVGTVLRVYLHWKRGKV
jgi:hypothetical protein